jgi:hypothetical protein
VWLVERVRVDVLIVGAQVLTEEGRCGAVSPRLPRWQSSSDGTMVLQRLMSEGLAGVIWMLHAVVLLHGLSLAVLHRPMHGVPSFLQCAVI